MAERIALIDPRFKASEPTAGRKIIIHPRKIYRVVSRTPDKIDLLLSTGNRRQVKPHEQLILIGATLTSSGLMGAYDNGKLSVQEFELVKPAGSDESANKQYASVIQKLFCGEVFYLDPVKSDLPIKLNESTKIPVPPPVVETKPETVPEITTPVNLDVKPEPTVSISQVDSIKVSDEEEEEDAVDRFEKAMQPGYELKIVPKDDNASSAAPVNVETPMAETVTEPVEATAPPVPAVAPSIDIVTTSSDGVAEQPSEEVSEEGPKRRGRKRSKDR